MKLLKKHFYLIVITSAMLFTFISHTEKAQAQDFNYKVNAMYIYYFAKYVNWSVVNTESITIGIIGSSPLDTHLNAVIANKKVYGKLIIVKRIAPEAASTCNMVVISKSETGITQKVSESIKNMPILLITEKEGYSRKGAQICIYIDDEDSFKTKFELSKSNLEKCNLKVSNELLALSVLVN